MKKKFGSVKEATQGWIVVDRVRDPAALKAWIEYRRRALGCALIDITALTVPHKHTPSTAEEAEAYAIAVAMMRNSIGWTSTRAKVPIIRSSTTTTDEEKPTPITGATLL